MDAALDVILEMALVALSMVVWLPDVDDKLDVTTEDPVVPPIAVWLLDVGDMMSYPVPLSGYSKSPMRGSALLEVLAALLIVEMDAAKLEVLVVPTIVLWLLTVEDEMVGAGAVFEVLVTLPIVEMDVDDRETWEEMLKDPGDTLEAILDVVVEAPNTVSLDVLGIDEMLSVRVLEVTAIVEVVLDESPTSVRLLAVWPFDEVLEELTEGVIDEMIEEAIVEVETAAVEVLLGEVLGLEVPGRVWLDVLEIDEVLIAPVSLLELPARLEMVLDERPVSVPLLAVWLFEKMLVIVEDPIEELLVTIPNPE
ncbi:MAG: hypothetical protein LQ346_008526, partial [Caloplaca aetnensis]